MRERAAAIDKTAAEAERPPIHGTPARLPRLMRRRETLAGAVLLLLVAAWPIGSRTQAATQPPPAQVVTLAGNGESGVVDGPAGTAQFARPQGIAVDAAGFTYVVDAGHIRRISPTGAVLTIAGGEEPGFVDGPAATARFSSPYGIAVDAAGTIYIADRENHRIRKLSAAGVVTTLAGTGDAGLVDGPGNQAQFNEPHGVAVDAAGVVYVADTLNYRIRRISPQGMVTTLAGGGEGGAGQGGYADGPSTTARFSFPTGLTVDGSGTVYVADTYNARIRAVSPRGDVRTVAGSGEDGGADGPAEGAQFSDPAAIAVDAAGTLYVVDKSHRIRRIAPSGAVTTLAGSGVPGFADGPAAMAQFDAPEGIAVDAEGTVYIADSGNHRIRRVPS